MAFLREMIDMHLGGRSVELCKGYVIVLFREVEPIAYVRIESLEDANRLEIVAKGVEGKWQPNYLYEGKPLSVSEFAAAINDGSFDLRKQRPTRKRATT